MVRVRSGAATTGVVSKAKAWIGTSGLVELVASSRTRARLRISSRPAGARLGVEDGPEGEAAGLADGEVADVEGADGAGGDVGGAGPAGSEAPGWKWVPGGTVSVRMTPVASWVPWFEVTRL